METLVPEDASKSKDEVEAQDNDEASLSLTEYVMHIA
ncbi:unnamed protein product [Ectocarpus fasciculatus]